MKRKVSRDVLTMAAGLALLAIFTLLRMAGPHAAPSFPSTYDTGRNGYAALYELLQREHLSVARFESPVGELPQRGVALVIAGDGALDAVAQSKGAIEAVDGWVRAGNRLYVFGAIGDRSAAALGMPAYVQKAKRARYASAACGLRETARGAAISGDYRDGFARGCTGERLALLRAAGYAPAIAYRRGKGSIVAMTTATPLDNWDLPRGENCRFAYALFAGAGRVAFDERPYGYAAGRTFWEVLAWPVRVAVFVTAVAVLLALAGANLPFAPPYEQPSPGGSDSGAYIASMARLLQRAHANGEIVRRLAIAAESMVRARAQTDARSRELLDRARQFRSIAHPDANDALAAGAFFAAVRKDYEW